MAVLDSVCFFVEEFENRAGGIGSANIILN